MISHSVQVDRWLGIDRIGLWLVRKCLTPLVRTTVFPADMTELKLTPGRAVCYVLERPSVSDLAVLESECIAAGLPRANSSLNLGARRERTSIFSLSRPDGWFGKRRSSSPPRLQRLLNAVRADPDLDVLIVPVAIFWGRSPEKEHGFFKLLFSDSWSVVGRLRKVFIILLHGRNTIVQFSPPVSVRQLVDEGLDEARTLRKSYRLLRVHFRRQRNAVIGPDLSHRRMLADSLLRSEPVRLAVAQEASDKKISIEKAADRARSYVHEIAADYSYAVIRMLDGALNWLWTKFYDGIVLNNIDTVRDVAAAGNGIVYLPCHRSHIDYLLLSYVLHRNGLVPPHIAAGVNLKLPLVGTVLRRGGAFFIRRTFKGNALYATVFREYVDATIAKGVPIEFFVEGGRSRSGRLLSPRPGLVSMTVRSFARAAHRPLALIPVYLGYEKLLEGQTYLSELSGKRKKKESLLGFVRSIAGLRGNFGRVYVNFGEPIYLSEFLNVHSPGWREKGDASDSPAPWVQSAVDALCARIMEGLNEAAAVNPVNLLALSLLASPRHAVAESELVEQLDLYLSLLRRAPYAPRVVVPEGGGRDVLAHGERLRAVERQAHALGDIISCSGANAVLLTYFRNNILHLFALPSLVACCFRNHRHLSLERVIRIVKFAYPFVRTELNLRWSEDAVGDAVRDTVQIMAAHGLLSYEDADTLARPTASTRQAIQLTLLAQGTLQLLQRFFITIALLAQRGSDRVTQVDLENLCQLMAQRLSLLYGFHSPDFFDKNLFRTFIETLAERGVVTVDGDGLVALNQSVERLEEDARYLFSDELRDSMLHVTQV